MIAPWLAGIAGGWLGASLVLHLAARRAAALGRRRPARAAGLRPALPGPHEALELAFLGDLQRGVEDVPGPLADALRARAAHLLVSSGDLACHGEAPWHGLVHEALDRAGLATPFRAVPGNHDLYPSRCRDDRHGGPVFERFLGARSWALDLGRLLLVGLDTGASWRAELEWPAVQAWLAARPERPWLLVTHRPPWRLDDAGQPPYEDLRVLCRHLRARPPVLYVCGHLHASHDTTREDLRLVVNADGGDVDGRGGRRRDWQLLRVAVAPDGEVHVAFERLPRRRHGRTALDRLAIRAAASRRRALGAVLAAPVALLLTPLGAAVPVQRPPLRRHYPTREEALAWLGESRPFAAEALTN